MMIASRGIRFLLSIIALVALARGNAALAADSPLPLPDHERVSFDCAHRPFVHPYFRARPGYDVFCQIAVNRATGPTFQSARTPNAVWTLWVLANRLCHQGIEIQGQEISCAYVPVQ